MRTVALMLSISLLGGCFPHNAKARQISKYTEGGLILAGIGAELLANTHTGANCDQMGSIGYDSSCHSTSSIYGGIGLGMILAGLTGFIATISTEEDDPAPTPTVDIKAQPEKPALKLPPGVTPNAPAPDAAPTGSAAPSTPAP
jgi:hypothetical protein